MSIQTFNIKMRNENGEKLAEKTILQKYFNKIAKESRKSVKGKTYEDFESLMGDERFDIFYNRLGYFETELKYLARDISHQITYKKHKKELQKIAKETNIVSEVINRYDVENENYLNTAEHDCEEIIKELRKILKRIIKIYEEHDIKENLVTGYKYK